jgi:ectoine hydroxylase-related dioxygenase (phytanoyl-CoA dioxygenase family)
MRALHDSGRFLGDPRALAEQFAEDGYVLARSVVDRHGVEQLAIDVMKVLADQGLLTNDENALERFRQTRASFYIAVQRLESFHALSHDPKLMAFVRALVGDDAFAHPRRLLRAMLPRIPELVTPPHQDFTYIRGTERTVTAWLPLAPCRAGEGALRLLVGSHRRGQLALHPSDALAGAGVKVADDDPDWGSADLEPGDVLVFHSMTVHGASPNTSEHIRLSADYRYQSASQPVAEASLLPSGYPEVPDWPQLLGDLGWAERWLSVPNGVEIVGLDGAPIVKDAG